MKKGERKWMSVLVGRGSAGGISGNGSDLIEDQARRRRE